jgi:hypothetical protein
MSFLWTQQATNKEDWPSFTTPTGQTIRLPPRRYILIGRITQEVQHHQIAEARQFLTEFHTLNAAPEPLARLTSHLQIFWSKEDKLIMIISLTNTSSRYLRQKLFLQLLTIFNMTPHTMVIQEENEKMPDMIYDVSIPGTLPTVLLETKKKTKNNISYKIRQQRRYGNRMYTNSFAIIALNF